MARSPLTIQPYDYIGDTTGRPLNYGKIYIGQAGLDPEFYPIPVYTDPEMTKPVDQPIRTNDGYAGFAGDFTELYASSEIYSVKILDKQGRKVLYKADMTRNNLMSDALAELSQAVNETMGGFRDISNAFDSMDVMVGDAGTDASFVADGTGENLKYTLTVPKGKDNYQLALTNGFVGTYDNWVNTTVAGIADEATNNILGGFVTIDSFELGATITQRNQALRHAADGKLYRWAGDLPKVVSASSTPANSGGFGANAWLEVSDTVLRQDILTSGLVTDALTKTVAPAGGVERTQRDKNLEYVSIKDYGAVGDGTLHTVAEWTVIGSRVYYPNLAAIQVAYPHVTALTDSIDWAATQQAVFIAPKVYCPKGEYVLNRVVKTLHNTTPRNTGTAASGVHIFGDGVQTAFTRNDEGECTRIFNAEETSTTQASDTANSLEACFAIHAPHTNITDMTLQSSRLGIYMGQDFTQPFTSLSSATYSAFVNLTINRCGTGILGLAAGGNHYVGLNNVNFYGCQIDYHLRSSFWWKITKGRGDANNNRHTFFKIRSDSSRVGYWNECGDTNRIYSWHAENMRASVGANPYPAPHHLPESMLIKSAAFIFSGSNQLNSLVGCHAENCDWSLHNNGYRNTFTDNGLKPSLCRFAQLPLIWQDLFAQYGGGISTIDDTIFAVDAALSNPNTVYLGVGANKSSTTLITRDVVHAPSTSSKSTTKEYQIEFGEVAKTIATTIPIWADAVSTINESAVIEITFLARSDAVGQVATFSANLVINAQRTSGRTFNNYVLLVNHSFRTYYATIREGETNVVAFTIEKDAAGRTLNLIMTSPWDLSGGTLFIKQHTRKL